MIRAAFILVFVGSVLGKPTYLRTTDTRIINGQYASEGEFPWQVSLQEPYNGGYWHFCGGSLISENYIMTAAHCYTPPVDMSVYAGSVDKFNGGTRLYISQFYAHPEYNSNEISMDYAILQLTASVTLTSNINTIAIPGPDYDSTSQFTGTGTTSGWGYIEYHGSHNPHNEMPLLLQKATLPVLSDAECEAYWGTTYQASCMICGGGQATGNNNEDLYPATCMGDSGGPLVQDIDGVTTLIGATSWGPSSCSSQYPSAWAKLSAVRPWIVLNTDLQ